MKVKESIYVRSEILDKSQELAQIGPLKKGQIIEMALEAGLPEVEKRIKKMMGKEELRGR